MRLKLHTSCGRLLLQRVACLDLLSVKAMSRISIAIVHAIFNCSVCAISLQPPCTSLLITSISLCICSSYRAFYVGGLCGGSYYRTAAILDAFSDRPTALKNESREVPRKEQGSHARGLCREQASIVARLGQCGAGNSRVVPAVAFPGVVAAAHRGIVFKACVRIVAGITWHLEKAL